MVRTAATGNTPKISRALSPEAEALADAFKLMMSDSKALDPDERLRLLAGIQVQVSAAIAQEIQ